MNAAVTSLSRAADGRASRRTFHAGEDRGLRDGRQAASVQNIRLPFASTLLTAL